MIQADGTEQLPNIVSRTLNSVKYNSLLPEAPLSGDGTGSRALGFRAQGPHRLLELARRQVKVGFHLGCEMGVMLEPQALRNHLEGKPFCDKAAGQKHPVTAEKLFRAQAGGPLNGVFQLTVGELKRLRHAGNRELFRLGELEQILPVRAHETLPFACNLKPWGILSHLVVQLN